MKRWSYMRKVATVNRNFSQNNHPSEPCLYILNFSLFIKYACRSVCFLPHNELCGELYIRWAWCLRHHQASNECLVWTYSLISRLTFCNSGLLDMLRQLGNILAAFMDCFFPSKIPKKITLFLLWLSEYWWWCCAWASWWTPKKKYFFAYWW